MTDITWASPVRPTPGKCLACCRWRWPICCAQDEIRRRYRNEQAYLSAYLHERGLLTYWPRQWCASYKYHCLPPWPGNYWREPRAPAGARVLVFHGTINPPDAVVGTPWRWRRYARPAPWVAEHWRE